MGEDKEKMMLHLQISDNLMKKVREVGQDQVQEKN
jgi:hypothetical protein